LLNRNPELRATLERQDRLEKKKLKAARQIRLGQDKETKKKMRKIELAFHKNQQLFLQASWLKKCEVLKVKDV
jgi:hypothetical protein